MPRQAAQNTTLTAQIHAYVVELYRELSGENVADLGTQNQIFNFILADAELHREVARWAEGEKIGEASTAPRRLLPHNVLYHRVRSRLIEITKS